MGKNKFPKQDDPKYSNTHQEGYLEKQASDDTKKFQKRWFVTLDNWLAYSHQTNGPLDTKKVRAC